MELSHCWALRSLAEFQKEDASFQLPSQALCGVVQGGVNGDLRRTSASFVNENPFFGLTIGGSLGAHKSQMAQVIEETVSHLDPARPIHLLGIGGIQDIFFRR